MNGNGSQMAPHGVIAFYMEGDRGSRAAELLSATIQTFTSCGIAPTWLSTNLDKGRIVPFEKSLKKIRKAESLSVTKFDLYVVPQEYGVEFFNRGFKAGISLTGPPTNAFSATFETGLVPDEMIEPYYRSVAELLEPGYGFRNRSQSADAFVAWLRPEFISDYYFRAGFLYRLWPSNLLNRYHLARRINGCTLDEWIRLGPERGVLTPFVGDTWWWNIEEDDVPQLEKALTDAEILFDAQKHFYPWVWTFAGRVHRGDLSTEEVIKLMQDHVRRTGDVPTPPRRWQESPNHPFQTDEAAVTGWLIEWRHPAGKLPDYPPIVMTAEESHQLVKKNLS